MTIDQEKTITKSEFKRLFIEELKAKGIEVNDAQVRSALDKTGRHARNKYGSADWNEEYNECEVRNAVCFYHEYKQISTFNRDGYKAFRKQR